LMVGSVGSCCLVYNWWLVV